MAADAERVVFVTVGTTAFDKLVEVLLLPSSLCALRSLRFTQLRIQFGRGCQPTVPADSPIKIEVYPFKSASDLAEDMEAAALVISHAGAGSIMEALDRKKDLIVVINEALMSNHQAELAHQMHSDGHVVATTCAQLSGVLGSWADLPPLARLPPVPRTAFRFFVDGMMGVPKC